MQIAKKQLLGFGGLALVVGMTTFAGTLPAEAVSVGGNVNVQVQVYGSNTETVINTPKDGDVFNNPVIDFSETHSHSYGTRYTLEKIGADGKAEQTWDLGHSEQHEDVSGTTNFSFDLNNYGGAGVYVIRSFVKNSYGMEETSSVQFTYKSIEVDPEGVVTDDTKVKFEVCYAPGTMSIVYQLKNSKGEVIWQNVINTPAPETGGCIEISVDLDDKNLDSGEYQIQIDSYDQKDGKGNLVGNTTITFDYKAPDAPNVPDTGSILAALNISRADYLITGIIAFVAISLAALFIIRRSHRK